ncbi:Hypothetical predicted protein [Cloeon dipterum]|uniref:Uncharacterized protein n=1 Tax=Cloeon dipterum TaxID=197152 RepID=A0A8S1DWW9_9INSE|nr:Hypothetical predicted protein [Cloeon dipterum]
MEKKQSLDDGREPGQQDESPEEEDPQEEQPLASTRGNCKAGGVHRLSICASPQNPLQRSQRNISEQRWLRPSEIYARMQENHVATRARAAYAISLREISSA